MSLGRVRVVRRRAVGLAHQGALQRRIRTGIRGDLSLPRAPAGERQRVRRHRRIACIDAERDRRCRAARQQRRRQALSVLSELLFTGYRGPACSDPSMKGAFATISASWECWHTSHCRGGTGRQSLRRPGQRGCGVCGPWGYSANWCGARRSKQESDPGQHRLRH